MANFLHWTWADSQQFGVTKASQLVLAQNRDINGRSAGLELIYIGTDHNIYDVLQTVPGDPSSWVDMFPLPTGTLNEVAQARQIAVGTNADGRLELIYIGTNSHLFRNAQPNVGHAGWSPAPSKFIGQEAKQISVALDSQNRLTLFYVGTNGKLYFDFQKAPGSNDWNGEIAFGTNGKHISGKQLAVARNKNNFNRLELFYVGHNDGLYVAKQQSSDILDWDGGDQRMTRDTVSWVTTAENDDGRLEIFYIDTINRLFHGWYETTSPTSEWSGTARFPGAKAVSANIARNQDGRLEVFYMGTDENLYHNWQIAPNSTWVGETQFPGDTGSHVAALVNARGSLESWRIGTNHHLYHSFQTVANAGWTNANGKGTDVQQPSLGLRSNSNYALEECSILTDVAITIHITEELYATLQRGPGSPLDTPPLYPGNDFSIQLNCYSPTGATNVWQQYVFGYEGDAASGLSADVDDWYNLDDEVLNTGSHLKKFKDRIPAGYELTMRLRNDASGNIIEIFYSVVDGLGESVAHKTINLSKHGVKQSDLSPIVAVELNFVGIAEGEFSGFQTGAGWIQYVSSALATVAPNVPTCAATPNTYTEETSNMTYGAMSSESTNLVTQTFSPGPVQDALNWPRPSITVRRRRPKMP